MATVTFKSDSVQTTGELPAVGAAAPTFDLVGTDLGSVTPDQFAGKRVVLNIFPSLDTGVCATSVRKFNELAAGLDNTVVVSVSMDLPFALARWQEAEKVFYNSFSAIHLKHLRALPGAGEMLAHLAAVGD